jgi:hypothetical protein
MKPLNEAELRLTSYLESHGYRWEHEPQYESVLGLAAAPTTNPDFLIERGDHRAVAEVRQFHTRAISERLRKAGGYTSLPPQMVYGPLRSALWEKADQLAPFADSGIPLIIAVSNPLGADVALDEHHVTAAMFGNPGYVIPIDTSTGGAASGISPHWQYQDYGVFRSPIVESGRIVGWENRHPHVSGVVVIHERLHAMDWREEIMASYRVADNTIAEATRAALEALREIDSRLEAGEEPDGAYQWLEVFELECDEAAPIRNDWFNGPRDKRYGFSAVDSYGEKTPPDAELA